jgi:hypothetical protein
MSDEVTRANRERLRALGDDDHRCVALTPDALGQQCDLTGGHESEHRCRGFAGGPTRIWKTGALIHRRPYDPAVETHP